MRRYYMAKNFTILYRWSVQRRGAKVQRSAGVDTATHCRARGDVFRRPAAPPCHLPAAAPHDTSPAVLPPSMPRTAHAATRHGLRRCAPPRATHPATALPHHCRAPHRPTVARRTLRTAAARHSHRRRVLRHPTTRAASLVTRAALPPPAIPSALRLCAPPRAPRHTPRTPRAAQRRCTTSGTTAHRRARIRAPMFSTARRSALPK